VTTGLNHALYRIAGATEQISRRDLLAGGGGLVIGAAAGAGIAVAAGAGSGSGSAAQLATDEAHPTPAEDLMTEHGLLVRILLIYRNLTASFATTGQLDAAHLHDSALIIHDYIEGFHEILEESYVFPRLLDAGQLESTVLTLLTQHGRGRLITELLLARTGAGGVLRGSAAGPLVAALDAFVRMYEPHEAREDTVIYPAYRSLLTPAEILEVGQQFAATQTEQFGADAFTDMLDRVAGIEQALGIYDISQFTPAAVTP
jgi:hemerythrin-like domain-containing protein